ncbi:ABC transporter permease [Pedobacter sp. NJ-S-72]
MLLLNLKIARRNLLKNKGFSLINIGGLAIGLACCMILLFYVSYEWNYNKQFAAIDRIYFAKTNLIINDHLALYMAEQRSNEISIRKVLGADLKSILILLNKDFIKLVLLSNIIAFPIAYILSKSWLQKYDYSVGISVWPFLIAAGLSIAIALLTVSVQSIKVARANAVDALKYE